MTYLIGLIITDFMIHIILKKITLEMNTCVLCLFLCAQNPFPFLWVNNHLVFH